MCTCICHVRGACIGGSAETMLRDAKRTLSARLLRVTLKCIVIRLELISMRFIISNTSCLFLSLVAANGVDSPQFGSHLCRTLIIDCEATFFNGILYYGQDKYLRFNVRFMPVQSGMLQAKSTSSRFLSQPRLF